MFTRFILQHSLRRPFIEGDMNSDGPYDVSDQMRKTQVEMTQPYSRTATVDLALTRIRSEDDGGMLLFDSPSPGTYLTADHLNDEPFDTLSETTGPMGGAPPLLPHLSSMSFSRSASFGREDVDSRRLSRRHSSSLSLALARPSCRVISEVISKEEERYFSTGELPSSLYSQASTGLATQHSSLGEENMSSARNNADAVHRNDLAASRAAACLASMPFHGDQTPSSSSEVASRHPLSLSRRRSSTRRSFHTVVGTSAPYIPFQSINLLRSRVPNQSKRLAATNTFEYSLRSSEVDCDDDEDEDETVEPLPGPVKRPSNFLAFFLAQYSPPPSLRPSSRELTSMNRGESLSKRLNVHTLEDDVQTIKRPKMQTAPLLHYQFP